jgi:hypothetical protein
MKKVLDWLKVPYTTNRFLALLYLGMAVFVGYWIHGLAH